MEDRTTIQISAGLRKELKRLAARRDKNYQELLSDMIDVFKELDKERTIISIPNGLANRLDEQQGDFKTKSEYVTHLLRLLLYEEQGEKQHTKKIPEERVRKRLRALGYMQ